MSTSLLTVGHSTRSLEELVALLRAHAVTTLVDVRRHPASQRHPHFDGAALRVSLPEHGVQYCMMGDALGGRRSAHPSSMNDALDDAFRGYADHMGTGVFAAAVDELLARAGGARVAVMCAEADASHCHRSLLADALVARGAAVHHIVDATRVSAHTLHASARVEGPSVTYPAAQRRLF